jgi:hypothetical protein
MDRLRALPDPAGLTDYRLFPSSKMTSFSLKRLHRQTMTPSPQSKRQVSYKSDSVLNHCNFNDVTETEYHPV